MTNRDKITSEELATFIFDGTHKHCDYCILKGQCYSGRCESRGTCINNIESWLSQESELTADEMFNNLGYIMDIEYETPTTILYKNIDTVKEIIIDKVSLNFGKRNKDNVPMLITEAEDKAIHKKIEELKKPEK